MLKCFIQQEFKPRRTKNMIKLEENKQRKRLRITMCVFYLIEIFLCSFPYWQYADDNVLYTYSVLDFLSYMGGSAGETNDALFAQFQSALPYFFLFLIIPIIGFFFCLFDKKRNLKNIVSILCCLCGVLSILLIISYALSIGSLIALLLYIAICFITTLAMFARITSDDVQKK